MVSINETSPLHLTELLEDALQELGRLHGNVDRARRAAPWTSRELLPFSASALDRLCAVVREGIDVVDRRLAELNAGVGEETSEPDVAAFEKSESTPTARVTSADSHALLTAYRATARALCASIIEARKISDATTAALLSALVHRLEKQLWLLASSESRPHAGLPTINLFLSC
jgi:DNA-binding ferritin-like protein